MLVLTRRVGQEIVINGNVEIKLLTAQRGRARLGITAPPGVKVHRKEVQERIRRKSGNLPSTQ